MMRLCLPLVVLASLGYHLHGWVLPSPVGVAHAKGSRRSTCFRTTPTTTEIDVLGGVPEFEAWFASNPKASYSPALKHQEFGNELRGLAFTSEPPVAAPTTPVVSIPADLVLKAPFSDPDWDLLLAQQLWEEFQKGTSSKMYGYCSLLARGRLPNDDECPPWTAPNALRHWKADELQLLQGSSAGNKLLEKKAQQDASWKTKYNKVRNIMTYEQFEWAMEAVTSRAFSGKFSSTNPASLAALAAPVVAALAGWTYVSGNPHPSEGVLAGLALVASAPAVWNVVVGEESGVDAVLLPLIDSANHLETADSTIEFDPLQNTISLSIGPKCFVDGSSSESQLYISYGRKSDAELLLNYGFLPGFAGEKDASGRTVREQLAETFLRNNS